MSAIWNPPGRHNRTTQAVLYWMRKRRLARISASIFLPINVTSLGATADVTSNQFLTLTGSPALTAANTIFVGVLDANAPVGTPGTLDLDGVTWSVVHQEAFGDSSHSATVFMGTNSGADSGGDIGYTSPGSALPNISMTALYIDAGTLDEDVTAAANAQTGTDAHVTSGTPGSNSETIISFGFSDPSFVAGPVGYTRGDTADASGWAVDVAWLADVSVAETTHWTTGDGDNWTVIDIGIAKVEA